MSVLTNIAQTAKLSFTLFGICEMDQSLFFLLIVLKIKHNEIVSKKVSKTPLVNPH